MSKDVTEILSCPLNVTDIWTEFNRNLNVRDQMLKIVPGEIAVLRMLGPFVGAQRMFIPSVENTGVCENPEVMSIAYEKNPAVLLSKIQSVRSKIVAAVRERPTRFFRSQMAKSYGNFAQCSDSTILALLPQMDSDPAPVPRHRNTQRLDPYLASSADGDRTSPLKQVKSLVDFLSIMEGDRNWQDCVLVNVMRVEHDQIRVFCLFRTIIDSLIADCRRINRRAPHTIILNGLKASNISVSRQGLGPRNSNFQVTISRECEFLSPRAVSKIFSDGLIDIPSFVERLNEKSYNGSYHYRVKSSYRMPEEFYGAINEEYSRMMEKSHVDGIDEDISEVPKEAFENMKDIHNPIANLEL